MENSAEKSKGEIIPGVPAGELVIFNPDWLKLTIIQRSRAMRHVSNSIGELAAQNNDETLSDEERKQTLNKMAQLSQTLTGLSYSGPFKTGPWVDTENSAQVHPQESLNNHS